MKRCGKSYGSRLTCRRLAGHKGPHALRLSVWELNKILRPRGSK